MTILELLKKIEDDYSFECEAGYLKNCKDWQELKKNVILTTSMPTHYDLGQDCCGFFMVLKDGNLYCNECMVDIYNAVLKLREKDSPGKGHN